MTNFRDHSEYNDIVSKGDAEGMKLVSDLSELYLATVPPLQFQERRDERASSDWLTRLLRVGWRPSLGGAMAAAIVAAALLSLSPWNGESQVNAEAIFARTSEAAQNNAPLAGGSSYHLVATMESPLQPESMTTNETWYTDSSHLRTEQDWTPGDQETDFGLAVNGDEAWLYGSFDGVFRVAHGPASELGATFGGPSQARDIATVLGQYVGGCQRAQQEGEETVANRTAYKVRVTPDPDACPEMAGVPEKDVIGKLGVLTVWVDKETFLPLKTEQVGSDGGLPGYVYTVTQIEVGGDIAESTFAYQAPEGVAVQEVADLTEAKNVLSGYAPGGTPE